MSFLSRFFRGSGSSAENTRIPVRFTETRQSIESPSFQVSPTQLDMLWGLGPTRSGVQINPHTALTIIAVFVAHKILGETLGMLPWVTYEGDEDEKSRRRAKENPVYALLRRNPNPEMSAFTVKETLMHHAVGWGNAYARIIRDRADRPRQLWPLLPDRTHPERKAGQLVYSVDRTNAGGAETLFPEEVFHVPGLSFDGLKGYSPIALCREGLGTAKAAELYAATFYGNGARVSGFLKYPGKLKPEAMANLRESFNAMHSGTGNAHKVGILEGGMEYIREGIPPEEAQFLETRKFSVDDVARLYRIPPHMLGQSGHTARATIEQASLEFLVYTMSPWFAKFEAEADRKLCGDGFYTKFDERALLRADLTARQNFYAAGRQWGWLSANDILRNEGELEIGPQGDVYLSPANETNAKAVMKQTDPAPAQNPSQAGPPGAHAGPFGGANPDAGKRTSVAATAARVVFEDAVWRMLRKEHHAITRGNADDTFYTAHAEHVREALIPAVTTLRTLLADSGLEPPSIQQASVAIDALAAERHADLNGNLPVLAAQKAGELIGKLTEAHHE